MSSSAVLFKKINILIEDGEELLDELYSAGDISTISDLDNKVSEWFNLQKFIFNSFPEELIEQYNNQYEDALKNNPTDFIEIDCEHFIFSYQVLYASISALRYLQKLIDVSVNNDDLVCNYIPFRIKRLYFECNFQECVFEAFKLVEVQAKHKSGLNDLYGVDLMRKAFASKDTNKGRVAGILTNLDLPLGEQQAQSDLFAGAIGFIKNPKSHNVMDVNKNRARELLYFANYLLRILNNDYSERKNPKE